MRSGSFGRKRSLSEFSDLVKKRKPTLLTHKNRATRCVKCARPLAPKTKEHCHKRKSESEAARVI
jgi:hypothetical protein